MLHIKLGATKRFQRHCLKRDGCVVTSQVHTQNDTKLPCVPSACSGDNAQPVSSMREYTSHYKVDKGASNFIFPALFFLQYLAIWHGTAWGINGRRQNNARGRYFCWYTYPKQLGNTAKQVHRLWVTAKKEVWIKLIITNVGENNIITRTIHKVNCRFIKNATKNFLTILVCSIPKETGIKFSLKFWTAYITQSYFYASQFNNKNTVSILNKLN